MTDQPGTTRISRRKLCNLLALSLLAPASATAAPMTLRGKVSYRERIALPRTAVVEVRLLDVSLADAPARTIAQTRIPARTSPIPFTLRFDRRQIEPRRSYALQARITENGQLLFISTMRHPVFTSGPDKTDIRVERVQGAQGEVPEPALLAGRWLAEDIRGGGVIDRLQSVLELGADGRVSGRGGCNRMSGSAKVEGSRISFGPLAATRIACTPAAMDQEGKFFAALEAARSWRIDQAKQKLILFDAGGSPVLRLARM